MPTKLEQVVAHVGTLSKLELDSIIAVAQAHKERLPDTTKCYLLDLPAELRNIIYYYAAITHLREFGNTLRCGLLVVNKKAASSSWTSYTSDMHVNTRNTANKRKTANKKSLKKLLDGLEGITKIQGFQFMPRCWVDGKVVRISRDVYVSPDQERFHVLGTLKLVTGKRDREVSFGCWMHEAKQYGLDYEIPEDYPAELLNGYDDEEEDLVFVVSLCEVVEDDRRVWLLILCVVSSSTVPNENATSFRAPFLSFHRNHPSNKHLTSTITIPG
ncbi:hypothetical protein M409DRAFT_53579 [Zasmidium cellare ATCC 36951]|uniref:Uncharacterized protein n=1 Tax=Zasmidium cellare ATCC 36951 TaxID=1080233 RepID=A0A6A6CQ88_ZASCE|nr:uncharacterized protein M409DRAFT_53579 [Zasmidium cellare ATCC 36951]KAF2168300.1 hypothetical protein M409DRAFT_53579 [Zasmidium cellare ATCC 36951]